MAVYNGKELDQDLETVDPYQPSTEEEDDIAEVNHAYRTWRSYRRPHERDWYLNAAMFRGGIGQWAHWLVQDHRLAVAPAPTHRKRLVINRFQPKVRARIAKFLKNRSKPEVIPATTELKHKLDARMTTKALDYAWRKFRLEQAYTEALLWSNMTGHGYWWYHWNPNVIARVQLDDPTSGEKILTEAPLGDIEIETGGPFEVLVADPTQSNIGRQPKIMRLTLRDVRDLRARYKKAKHVPPETTDTDVFMGARQMASLTAYGTPMSVIGYQEQEGTGPQGRPTKALVKELFCAPSETYPMGQYKVVAGDVLLEKRDELPHGFADMANPYPCTDFPDIAQAGQYWSTTIAAQLVEPQREYNEMRSAVAEHLALMKFPKLITAVQHSLPNGAWTSRAGEVIKYVAHPNIPPPQAWVPPPINPDVWQVLQMLVKEFEDISHIFPEAEGRVGESKSGFQTNLLQEATDAVHAPDIRAHELAHEESYMKIRRLMKRGYGIPRLLTVAGRDMKPEVFEFSGQDIDEHAEIVVQAGSALPTYKAAKIQAALELYHAGLLGNPQDPEVSRKVLGMLDIADTERLYEDARRDEEDAELENQDVANGKEVPPPEFFQNHEIHYRTHANQLKSDDSRRWAQGRREQLIAHTILTVKFINPESAIQLAQQYNMPQLVADLMQQQQQQAMGQPPPGGMMPPDQGAPPPDMMGQPGMEQLPPEMMGPPPGEAQSGADQFNPEAGFGPQGAQSYGAF